MPPSIRPAAYLLLVLGLACGSKGPRFTYDTGPGLETVRSFALDPRQLIFRVDGRREVDAGTFRTAAILELKAKGFTQAGAGVADAWVNVIVLADGADRDEGPARKLDAGGEGRGKGRGARGAPPELTAARHSMPSGDLTVMVKVMSRDGQRTLWYGRADLPARKPGQGPQEDHVRTLMEPLPARR
ncbi:hypothetical protein [Geothrix sp. 21YS21S-2]|uniref:hypothetical protein n=1 Tax=Geothrix sp. 21YS21S-2 TaxID=3068893 RepID=UPI0027B94BA3|nr:hypothetical protein [Geothrix sp. 21YS21S-2]